MTRLVDHVITFDGIGPRIDHPVVCSAIHKPLDCPVYQGLRVDAVDATLLKKVERGVAYVGVVDDDGTVHLAPDDDSGTLMLARLAGLGEFIAAAREEVMPGG